MRSTERASARINGNLTQALWTFFRRGVGRWLLARTGNQGVHRGDHEVVDRCCALARSFADQLQAAGYQIGNEVALNQVLVSFGTDEETNRVIAAVQASGTCWMGGTTWRGKRYMRISVSNHLTTQQDIDRSVAAIRSTHPNPGP